MAFSTTFAQQLKEEKLAESRASDEVATRCRGFAHRALAHAQLHDAALAMTGFEGSSRRVELGPKDQAKLNKVMRKEFDALSITMPLKSFGVEICDEIDEVATRTQSVNSLLVRDGKLLGASTDGDGFVNALRGQFDASPEGLHVVVLGAGARRGPSSTDCSPGRRVGGGARPKRSQGGRASSHATRTSTTSH